MSETSAFISQDSAVPERVPEVVEHKAAVLPPPMQLETGSIVTLRMRGHSRTDGEDYFAPAIVLRQYDNQTGDIEVLVWDPSAGSHYNNAFPVRDVASRGEGNEREMYEARSNIGQVLFSPNRFGKMIHKIQDLDRRMTALEHELTGTNVAGTNVAGTNVAGTNVPLAVTGMAPAKPLPPPLTPFASALAAHAPKNK